MEEVERVEKEIEEFPELNDIEMEKAPKSPVNRPIAICSSPSKGKYRKVAS